VIYACSALIGYGIYTIEDRCGHTIVDIYNCVDADTKTMTEDESTFGREEFFMLSIQDG
jgi:hypothetical protein